MMRMTEHNDRSLWASHSYRLAKIPANAAEHVRVQQEATGQVPEESPSDKNPHAVALGRLGGQKGGKARAKKLTAEQRREIARKAAQARWRSRES